VPRAQSGEVDVPGRAIVWSSWLTNLAFAGTAVPAALGVDAFDDPAVATALVLFGISMFVWPWTLMTAFVRSARGDDIAVATLFGSVGDAPKGVRRVLFWALGVCLAITVGTAAADPFGVLVPMLSLGLLGLWAARHGQFPQRKVPPRR
jgi:hypothetical protein